MQSQKQLKRQLAGCLDSLQQLGSATDLAAVQHHAESTSRCFEALQPLLLRTVGAVPAGTWAQVAAFLRDSRQLHASACLNALRQLNAAADAAGGLQQLPAAAVKAVSQLLRAFLLHAGISGQNGTPLPRPDSPECKACRGLLARSGFDSLLSATAAHVVTALRGLSPPNRPAAAAAAAQAAASGAQPLPLMAVESDSNSDSSSNSDSAHLWELAGVVFECCGALSSQFTSPDKLPTGPQRLQSLALPFVSLAALVLYRMQAAQGPAATAAEGDGDARLSSSTATAAAASSAQNSSASPSLSGAAEAAAGSSQQPTPEVAAGSTAELTERESFLVAAAMRIAAVFAVRLQELGCRPSLPTSIPDVLQDSQDLQLLMLVFFALAVQQVHRRISQASRSRSSTHQQATAATVAPPPPAAADHAVLLESLGLSRLSAVAGELQAASREPGAPGRFGGNVLQETMYVAADVAMYSYTSRMPAVWVSGKAGAAQVPALPSPAVAAPLLRTLVQYLELSVQRSSLIRLIVRIAPGPAAAALQHAGSLLPAARSGDSSSISSADRARALAGGAAVREVYEVVLLRLGAIVLDAFRDEGWFDAAHKQDLSRKWLHLVKVLSDDGPKTSPSPVALVTLGQVCSQSPEVVAAVLEAGLRCSAAGPFAPINSTPSVDQRLWSFVMPVTKVVEAAASLDDPTSNLCAVAAARPEASSAVFGLLMSALKDTQALRGGGLAMQHMPGLVVAVNVAFTAVRTADTSFDPLHPAWDVSSSRGLELFSASATSGSSGSSTRSGDGTSGGADTANTAGNSGASKLLGRRGSLPHLWLVVVGQALRCASSCLLELLHKPAWQQLEPLPASKLAIYGPSSMCLYVAVVQWLGVALAQLQLPGEPAAAAAALKLLRQQQEDLLSVMDMEAASGVRQLALQPAAFQADVVDTSPGSSAALADLMRRAVNREAASKGLQLGAGLCNALPLPLWCNNPGCTALTAASERQLVRSKGVCSGCRQAKYCCRACQTAHWSKEGHKAACRRLQKAGTAGSAAAAAAPAGATRPTAT